MPRKTVRNLFVVALFTLLSFPAILFGMEPGKWEITSQVEMTGMPMQMPPMTVVQCLTESQPAPADLGTNDSGCRMLDMKTEGDTVTWSMACDNDGGKMTGKGTITYRGGTFDGTMTMEMVQDGETMEILTRLNGKKIGPCDK